jgi:transposase-like protein
MSAVMEEDIKRWTARRKAALVLEIIQGKTTVAEASPSFDLPPSEIEEWVDEGKRGMENACGPSRWRSARSTSDS